MKTVLAEIKKLDRDIKVVIASVFLFALGYSSVMPYIPILLKELGADYRQIGLVFSVITGSAAISALIGGLVLSRFEIRSYMLFTTIIIVPFALVLYFAKDWRLGLLAGVLDGISYASAPAYSLVVYLRSRKSRLGFNFGVFSSAFSAGSAIAPAIGGFLARTYGIRTPFLFSFVMLAFSSLVLLLLRPQKLNQPSYGLVQSMKKILESKSFAGIMLLFMILLLFETAYDPFLSMYLKEEHALNYQSIGMLISTVFLINLFSSPYIGSLADRKGSSFAIGITLIGYSAFLLLLGAARQLFLVFVSLAGIGIFKQVYTLSTIAASRNTGDLPPHVAYANLHFLRTSLSVFGPYFGGYLASHSLRFIFYFTAGFYLLVGAAALAYSLNKNKLANWIAKC